MVSHYVVYPTKVVPTYARPYTIYSTKRRPAFTKGEVFENEVWGRIKGVKAVWQKTVNPIKA